LRIADCDEQTVATSVVRFEDFSLLVVGESNYQDAIETAAGGRTEESCEKIVTAVLVLEDSNPYDRKAVQVVINGRLCGYLSREDARAYRKLLKKAGYPDGTTSWNAMIVGGWDRGPDDQGHFGVKLNLPLYG
jgi:hypothetical protein